MEDKRTQILCSGLLIKSPTKSERKAHYSGFWKVRWCVLARITQTRSPSEKSRLIFCYYKNEDCFRDDKLPLGVLTIDRDSEIQSWYDSQAGFDHLFSIKCRGKIFVKLSAPSCKLRSTWVAVLYHHLLSSNPQVVRSRRPSSAESSKRRSDSGVKSRTNSQGSVDSGSFSLKRNDSKSSTDKTEASLPEESLPVHRLSRTRSILKYLERVLFLNRGMAKEDGPEHAGEADDKEADRHDDMKRRIYCDVFMLCEACQGSPMKKEKTKIRRSSSSKRNSLRKHASNEIETQQSIVERTSSCPSCLLLPTSSFSDTASLSRDSAIGEEDFNSDAGDRTYSEIDEKWLMKVREIMANTVEDGKSQDKGDTAEATGKDGDSVGSSASSTDGDDQVGGHDDNDGADEDGEEYVDMHAVQEEVKRLMREQSEQRSVVRARINNSTEPERVLFEMNI